MCKHIYVKIVNHIKYLKVHFYILKCHAKFFTLWMPLPAGEHLLNTREGGLSEISEDSVNAGDGFLLMVVESSRTRIIPSDSGAQSPHRLMSLYLSFVCQVPDEGVLDEGRESTELALLHCLWMFSWGAAPVSRVPAFEVPLSQEWALQMPV